MTEKRQALRQVLTLYAVVLLGIVAFWAAIVYAAVKIAKWAWLS